MELRIEQITNERTRFDSEYYGPGAVAHAIDYLIRTRSWISEYQCQACGNISNPSVCLACGGSRFSTSYKTAILAVSSHPRAGGKVRGIFEIYISRHDGFDDENPEYVYDLRIAPLNESLERIKGDGCWSVLPADNKEITEPDRLCLCSASVLYELYLRTFGEWSCGACLPEIFRVTEKMPKNLIVWSNWVI